MDEDEGIIVRCSRCSDVAEPGMVSTKRTCRECGRKVWLAAHTTEIIARRYPTAAVTTVCMQCRCDDAGKSVGLPEQVEIMRAGGDSDSVIVYKLAIADVAGGSSTLEEAEAEIVAFPDGLKAKAFPEAMRRAAMLVATTRRSPN